MKIIVKGLNACIQRNFDIKRYVSIVNEYGHEIVENPEAADMILMWGCAFRKDFSDNSLEAIQSYVKKYGSEKIVVCGCLPAIDNAALKKVYDGPYFHWKNEEEGLRQLLEGQADSNVEIFKFDVEENITDDIDEYRRQHPDENVSFYEQHIKALVSFGCNYKCSYCSERLAFPPYRSVAVDKIVDGCRKAMAATGMKKIALLADSLGEYGNDIGSSLPELMTNLLALDKDVTFALMNIHPLDYLKSWDYLNESVKNRKVFKLSVPIQSANNDVLKRMNRKYKKDDIDKIFSKVNEYELEDMSTHIIAGFPGEDENAFSETVGFILKHKPRYVMASSYMESPNMNSSQIDQKVSREVMHERIIRAAEEFRNNGIICNYDECEFFRDRADKLRK